MKKEKRAFALSQRAVRPVVEPGTEYNDFKSVLAEIPRIGFLTDKDMSPERNDGQFLAAQYILAPTILDLNNPNYTYVLLDCTNLLETQELIHRYDLQIVYMNKYGKTLTRGNPK